MEKWGINALIPPPMNFVSFNFLVFLIVTLVVYWLILKRNSHRVLLLLFTSYVFYGAWDWRFLILIFISSLVDYWVGLRLSKTDHEKKRKYLLYTSLVVNLGLLFTFKYFNFFISSFAALFSIQETITLNVILPVGISFYTLQTLSYTLDVYRKKIEASKNVVNFFAYVSFFPQLVAGPIEQASRLLPQFDIEKKIDKNLFEEGVSQIIWGFFKKMVIANNASVFTGYVFSNLELMDGWSIVLALILSVFQFYGDFSGYSDIAIGTGKLFGYRLSVNFRYPLFAQNHADFWQRWHITLMEWLREYIMKPLGRPSSKKIVFRNIFIVFVVSGLWHGASLNFMIWGVFQSLFYIPIIWGWVKRKYKKDTNYYRLPRFIELWRMTKVLSIFAFSGIFFKVSTLSETLLILYKVTKVSACYYPERLTLFYPLHLFIMLGLEWFHRDKDFPLAIDYTNQGVTIGKLLLQIFIALWILFFGASSVDFIYFQF